MTSTEHGSAAGRALRARSTRLVVTGTAALLAAGGLVLAREDAGAVPAALPAAAPAAPVAAVGPPDILRLTVKRNGVALNGDSGTAFVLSAYNWGASTPVSTTGAATGRLALGDLTVVHPVGPGSVVVAGVLATNAQLDLKLTVQRSAAGAAAITYDLTTCTLGSIKHSASDGPAEDQLTFRCRGASLTSTAPNGGTVVTRLA